jgi:hypothetical protein
MRPEVLGSRVARALWTLLLIFGALLVATSATFPVRIHWGFLKLTATGAARPLLFYLSTLVTLGVLPDGWLRRLAISARSAPSPRELPRSTRLIRSAVSWTAAAFLCLPVVLPPDKAWPSEPYDGPGYLLVAAAVSIYAVLSKRTLFGVLRPSGYRIEGADLWLLVLLPLYVLSTANDLVLTSGDNQATRLIAPQIVRTGSVDLTGVAEYREKPGHYSAVVCGNRLLSAFPLGTGLLAVPHALLVLPFSPVPVDPDLAGRWEKHFSALCLLASTALLFLALRRRFREGPALATSLVFAVAATAFSCAGQAMFSTTGEVLCFCVALFFLVPEERPAAAGVVGGLALAAAFLCRPTAAIASACIVVWVWLDGRRPFALRAGGAFLAGSVLASAWLFLVYGHPLGGYGLLNARAEAWGTTFLPGLAGTLVSPSRGLLVHFPYLLLVPFAFRAFRDEPRMKPFWVTAVAATTATVLLSAAYTKWWGGDSIGPRLLTEASPFIAIISLPLWMAFPRLRFSLRTTAVVLTLFAGLTQILGTWSLRAATWNGAVVVDWNPAARWSLRDSQLLATWWPDWFPSWKREPRFLTDDDSRRWIRLDLSPAANTRYDRDPFRPSPDAGAPNHYSALDAPPLNRPDALFHFLPRGDRNAVTTCQGAGDQEIALPSPAAGRLHLLLTAGATRPRPGEPRIADLILIYDDGLEEHHPLRLDRDVWEYDPGRRAAPVDVSRIYLGRADEPDVLVRLEISPARPHVPIKRLRLENAEPGAGEGVTLFAATVEIAAPSP